MCSLSEYQGLSMRTGLSARGKIERGSDKGDSYIQWLVRVCGGVRVWLPRIRKERMK